MRQEAIDCPETRTPPSRRRSAAPGRRRSRDGEFGRGQARPRQRRALLRDACHGHRSGRIVTPTYARHRKEPEGTGSLLSGVAARASGDGRRCEDAVFIRFIRRSVRRHRPDRGRDRGAHPDWPQPDPEPAKAGFPRSRRSPRRACLGANLARRGKGRFHECRRALGRCRKGQLPGGPGQAPASAPGASRPDPDRAEAAGGRPIGRLSAATPVAGEMPALITLRGRTGDTVAEAIVAPGAKRRGFRRCRRGLCPPSRRRTCLPGAGSARIARRPLGWLDRGIVDLPPTRIASLTLTGAVGRRAGDRTRRSRCRLRGREAADGRATEDRFRALRPRRGVGWAYI